ncbi:MAG TPA: sulfatase [Armatimonadetes bacterium]|nr:sulfatase [Armatimonadota bacterium]
MNVVLVVVDTLRADHLSCYGYQRKTSPALDELAGEGVTFESFWAPCIPTHPGFTSLFTGTHGITHGIVSQGRRGAQLPAGLRTLPEILRGKVTTAAVDNLAGGHSWFGRGYDHYLTLRQNAMEWIATAALKWLHTYRDQQPFFLFLHPWDPHSPYLAPGPYRHQFYPGDGSGGSPEDWEPIKAQLVYPFFKRFLYDRMGNPTDLNYIVAQYDAEIRYCDEHLGRLFTGLKELGLWENTAILVTADHGESMTEHHVYFEHHGIYDCVLHVPLIVRLPEGAKAGLRVTEMFQHLDIAPTICDLLGVEKPAQFEGRSLMPALQGEEVAGYEAIYACEASRMAKWAIRTKEWKLLKNVDPGQYHVDYDELYHVADDPHETQNLLDQCPAVRDRLELQLNRWREQQLGPRPDPVRVEMGLLGSTMEGTRQEGLQYVGKTFAEWIRDYQRRFVPPEALPAARRAKT